MFLLLAAVGSGAGSQESGARLVMRSDSIRELQTLWGNLRAARADDAAEWHRAGLLAWSLVPRAARRPGRVIGANNVRWLRIADSALLIATYRAPDSARFGASLADFLATHQDPMVRASARRFADRAVSAAERTGDPVALARASIVSGDIAWREWIQFGMRARVRRGSRADPGDDAYAHAVARYHTALRALPTDERAAQRLFRVLTEKFLWSELAAAATSFVARAPAAPAGHFALGLAQWRLREAARAAATFDRALALSSAAERERLLSLDLLSAGREGVRQDGLDSAARARQHSLRWRSWDPLWSTPENEAHLEFLARATEADLLFTTEFPAQRGSESDRGRVLLRRGYPSLELKSPLDGGLAGVTIRWLYPGPNGAYQFTLAPSFGTAPLDFEARAMHEERLALAPITLTDRRQVDSLAPTLARFRSRDDSTELVVATRPLWEQLLSASDTRVALRTDFYALDERLTLVARDSLGLNAQPPTVIFTTRVGTGRFRARVEVSGFGASRAARADVEAATDSAHWSTHGFGMSDVLLATATAHEGTADGWRTIDPTPLIAAHRRSEPIVLVWETYGLRTDSSVSRYAIELRMEKARRGTAGRIAARILGGARQGLSVSDAAEDGVTLGLERVVPAGERVADALRISLGDTPEGSYIVTVTVTDRRSGARVSRTLPLHLSN
ncbi:MAG: hypothetical protein K2X99_03890 [Gemmatimonadaceae bacterium]|nr:hypothetical protein [Gemmatimonadaceae bacterium]